MKLLRYIELKSGHNDNGPAWIGYVTPSRRLVGPCTSCYRGAVFWNYIDGCIQAFPSKPKLVGLPPMEALSQEEMLKRLEDKRRNPRKPNAEFVKKAIADIPDACLFLESQLGLRDRTPRDFDSGVLIKERLAETPGIYEDFFEPGHFTPVLKTPGKPTDGRDRSLRFGISSEATNNLLTLLGASWGKVLRHRPRRP